MSDVIVDALLAMGAAITLWCTLGFLRAPNAFARMHYLTPVSTLATLAVALAIVVGGGDRELAIKALIVFVVTALTSPVTQYNISHALCVRNDVESRVPPRDR